jgi:hypothetical protein
MATKGVRGSNDPGLQIVAAQESGSPGDTWTALKATVTASSVQDAVGVAETVGCGVAEAVAVGRGLAVGVLVFVGEGLGVSVGAGGVAVTATG